ncbi:MAG: TolC family protein [Elusimicrobia bacterium]|nr:TolC family protein [Elusimicrobiota bacterium]
MRKHSFLLLVIFLLSFEIAYGENVQRVLTMEDGISTAMMNSQDLLYIKEQVLYSKYTVDEAKCQIYPKIDLNVSASRFDNAIPCVLPPSFSSIYLPQGNIDTYYSTRFSLWQYLYAGGRYTTNLRLAETKYSEMQSQFEAMANQVELQVKKAFYECLLVKEKIRIYEKAITEGEKEKITGLARLKSELIKAKHNYEKLLLKFISTVGIELDTVIEIKGELNPPKEDYDLEKCLAWAYQYRPELKQTQFRETMDGLRVNLSIIERYPTITLGANYDLFGEKVSLDQRSWNATINMNIPLFDGWVSSTQYRQRKNQARQGQLKRAQIEDQIRFEVRDAYLDYAFWKARLNDLYKKAQAENIEEALSRLDTIYESLLSQANLEWSIGKSLKQ